MATLGSSLMTYLEWAQTLAPDGGVLAVAEQLAQQDEVLGDVPFLQANGVDGHETAYRAALPTVSLTGVNDYVTPTKGQESVKTFTMSQIEAYSQVDKRLAKKNGNSVEWLLMKAKGYIQAMRHEAARLLFYGDHADAPKEFDGLATLYNSLSGERGDYTLTAAGSTAASQTSIYLICWGENAYGVFPKGTVAGLEQDDIGEETATDGSGGVMRVLRSHYMWNLGFVVSDFRYCVRICNIEIADLTTDHSGDSADLIDELIQAVELPPELTGKTAIYCNRDIRTWMRRQAVKEQNVNFTYDTVGGKRMLHFNEIPVKRCDAILSTEAVVS